MEIKKNQDLLPELEKKTRKLREAKWQEREIKQRGLEGEGSIMMKGFLAERDPPKEKQIYTQNRAKRKRSEKGVGSNTALEPCHLRKEGNWESDFRREREVGSNRGVNIQENGVWVTRAVRLRLRL